MKKIFFIAIFIVFLCNSTFAIDIKDSNKLNINNWYNLTIHDKFIINKIIYKVSLIIKKNDTKFKNTFLNKFEDVVSKYPLTPKSEVIFKEIIVRIKDINDKNAEEKLINNNITISVSINNHLSDFNIDFNEVKKIWLWWYNKERSFLWKHNYIYNSILENTAFEWSEISKNRWTITHKRDTWDSYYSYNKITKWFASRWVVCKNIFSITHTENIWWWTFSCKDWECTQELINWIEGTFNFFMSEKYKIYKPHYSSIINNYFNEIWLWIAVSKQNNNKYKYYLTVHYCTELVDK